MQVGRIVFNPFILTLIWAFIELGFTLSKIWGSNQESNQKLEKDIDPNPNKKENAEKKVAQRIEFKLFSKSCLLIFVIVNLYNFIFVLSNPVLNQGIFQSFPFTMILLALISLCFLAYIFLFESSVLTLIYLGIISFFEICCLFWIIPSVNHYSSFVWLYLPLLVVFFDLLLIFIRKESKKLFQRKLIFKILHIWKSWQFRITMGTISLIVVLLNYRSYSL